MAEPWAAAQEEGFQALLARGDDPQDCIFWLLEAQPYLHLPKQAVHMAEPWAAAQEEGYQAALACDGEHHNDVRLKVEPCRSAGVKRPQRVAPGQPAQVAAAAAPAPVPAGPAPKVRHASHLEQSGNRPQGTRHAAPGARLVTWPSTSDPVGVEQTSSHGISPVSSRVVWSGHAPAPQAGLSRGCCAVQTSGYDVAYVGNIAFNVTPGQLEKALAGCSVTKARTARLHSLRPVLSLMALSPDTTCGLS